MNKEELPEIEFEGPMGIFYAPSEVSIDALRKGIRELQQELARRTLGGRQSVKHKKSLRKATQWAKHYTT